MHYKYVVLGGGNSSGYAAKEFVANGVAKGEVAIITKEGHYAYERPALSKAYLFPEGPARLPGFHTSVGGGGERQTEEWYSNNGIQYMLSTTVTAADLASHSLSTSSSAAPTITYDNLIIATGCRATHLKDFGVPGAELGNIMTLRDVADADALVAAIKRVKEAGGTAVVVGGGYIGAEVGAGLAANGIPTTIVFPEKYLMNRIMTPEIAAFYEKFYQGKGITFVRGAAVKGFDGKDGQVSGVRYTSGESTEQSVLAADLVVVGVGAQPEVLLFKGQLELAAGGIKVDSHMATDVKGVYAVGDVAAFPLLREGGALVRQEHVTHCRQSAAQAVKASMGLNPAPYDYLPFFYSRVFNLSWVFYGKNVGTPVHFGDFEAGKFGAFWVDGGKVVGGFLESGSADDNNALKKVVVDGAEVQDVAVLAAQGLDFAKCKM